MSWFRGSASYPQMLWAWVPFDDIARMHNDLIKKFPHRKPYYSK